MNLYTAGQFAYHGTKFLGGSEEDAQIANFLGNLIGGYTASSATSKFSLNKVKVDVGVPNELKDRLLNQFINAKNSHELMNILHHQDEELRGCLLEMIFTSEN